MAIGWASPAIAQAPAPAAPDYAKPATWLCLPGRTDICSTPVATTALNPNGYGSTGRSSVARNAPIDCFYVYPTVSSDQGLNSDLTPGREERLMTESQFARFASVCRPFVPIYRQMTLGAVAAAAAGVDLTQSGLLAYGDVLAAWRNYIRTKNGGRPFVLIGHSQGSLMLQQLIAREIETKPDVARRMKLAIIPGYNVFVQQGKVVGGTFKRTPLCSKPGQSGCVMSWVSFRERNLPPRGAIFGIATEPGMTVACVNPARPGSTTWERLDSYWFARSTLPVAGGPIQWSTDGAAPTPYLRTEGLVSARCINDGPRGYLSIRTNADPQDKRTDRIGGEVAIFGLFLPGWGMHLADIAAAQGDLVRLVEVLGSASRN
ncbi:DUF3089 domain-containing protein [Sphingomonas lutea]|uniref:DUF3089 domain-containing protein n=2 Tax=Sphingomonas lutea TaxID=1045317 RepID=A0A7G9SJD5_9SPHN|nr:DUF3089 domain-containing protein [Sphingomonas lutea]QNN67960.1 DUF3089 domain-containing protein [Sphingomonas lutea]